MLKRTVRKKYALDLGSSNSRLWESEKGILIDEPTVLAISAIDNSLVALGKEARLMLGKTPETLSSFHPVRSGVVTDVQSSAAFIRSLLNKVNSRFQPLGPNIMVSCGSSATQVERRALLESLLKAGAAHAYLVDATLASAIGAGIPVSSPSGSMVVNFGSGTTEAAVLSLGGAVLSQGRKIGSDALDKAIADYIKQTHGLVVGEQIAEEIKLKIGSAVVPLKTDSAEIEISGRDLVYGLPRTVVLNSREISETLSPVLREIIYPIKAVLEDIPPELASDVIEKGIMMTGGGALLRHLDKFLTDETGIPSHVAEEPELCCVRGVGVVLENLELWKRSVSTV